MAGQSDPREAYMRQQALVALRRFVQDADKFDVRAPQVTTFQVKWLTEMLRRIAAGELQSAEPPVLRDAAGNYFFFYGISSYGGPDKFP